MKSKEKFFRWPYKLHKLDDPCLTLLTKHPNSDSYAYYMVEGSIRALRVHWNQISQYHLTKIDAQKDLVSKLKEDLKFETEYLNELEGKGVKAAEQKEFEGDFDNLPNGVYSIEFSNEKQPRGVTTLSVFDDFMFDSGIGAKRDRGLISKFLKSRGGRYVTKIKAIKLT